MARPQVLAAVSAPWPNQPAAAVSSTQTLGPARERMSEAIWLVYSTPFSASDFSDLVEAHTSTGVTVSLLEADPPGPQASLEWLASTVVAAFIAKSYFDGILKEIGKDHYQLIKASVKRLYPKLFGSTAPVISVVGTAGKIRSARKYSLLFSMLAEAEDGLKFKLLIEDSTSQAEYDAAVEAFVDFLDAFHRNQLTSEAISDLKVARVVGKTVLLAYSATHGRVRPVDPLAKGEDA